MVKNNVWCVYTNFNVSFNNFDLFKAILRLNLFAKLTDNVIMRDLLLVFGNQLPKPNSYAQLYKIASFFQSGCLLKGSNLSIIDGL